MKQTHAPLVKRTIAYIIDWYLGAIFASLPIVFIYSCTYNDKTMISNLLTISQKNTMIAIIAGVLSLLFAFFYYVFIPYKIWQGQTLGKHIMKIKIVQEDNQNMTFSKLFLRQVIGLWLIEGAAISASATFRQLSEIISGQSQVILYWQYIAYAITFVSCLLLIVKQKSLHDYLAKTDVITQ